MTQRAIGGGRGPSAILVAAACLLALLVVGCSTADGRAAAGGSSPSSGTRTQAEVLVRVAAASSLRFVLEDLVAAWGTAHPDIAVEPVYGSSGTLVAQVEQGAPFDIFFSADMDYPRALEAAGLADAGATRLYAVGTLVAWVPAASRLDVEGRGLEALADPAVRSVAIANPDQAPYGRAAIVALDAAGLADVLEPKLVIGENVAQAAQYIESGNADAGIIPLSLALSEPLRAAGRYAVVPRDTHPALEQGAVVLRAAIAPAAAAAFLDFVLGPEGRAILDRYGLLPPAP